MVMRIVMILVLVFALAGCLKKTADENVSVEPAVTEEAATAVTDAAQEAQTDTQAVQEDSASMEKPSFQDIQQALANAKLYEGKIDGIPGPKTRKAIESFQSQNGLKADGKVGPKTWQKLKEYLNKEAQ
ncbi:MAG: peptidoglycan-binding domain-containing protein [Candidatus Omnitrophota bacterium]|nr:peptidoglycan-binding domain-containing protein [Candidatus Omnitrophota bacterium]